MNHNKERLGKIGLGLLLCAVILLQGSFLVFQIFQKSGYFIDETYSYGLSNSFDSAFLNSDREGSPMQDRWVTSEYFNEYITVQDGEGFAYDRVWENQVKDVHPPLFYLTLHTISSFFPEQFSKWMGESINLICFIVTQIFLFLTSLKVSKNNKYLSLSVIILYGASTFMWDTFVYIRMYSMLTMWSVILIYLHVKLIDKKQNFWLLIPIGIVTYLGSLTQYYFLILAFFMAIAYCIYLLYLKLFKKLLIYMAVMGVSVGAMLLTFPAVFEHLFGGRSVGNKTLDNASDLLGWVSRLYSYVRSILSSFMHLFGHRIIFAIAVICVVIAAAVVIVCCTRMKKQGKNILVDKIKNNIPFIFVCFVTLMTFLVVSLICFDPYSRYIYNILPLITVCIIMFLGILVKCINRQKNKLYIFLLIACILLSGYNYLRFDSSFLYTENYEMSQMVAKDYNNCYGILFCDEKTAPPTQELFSLREIKAVYCTSEENASNIEGILGNKDTSNGIIVWVDTSKEWSSGYDSDKILQTIRSSSRFKNNELLYSYGLVDVYHIY